MEEPDALLGSDNVAYIKLDDHKKVKQSLEETMKQLREENKNLTKRMDELVKYLANKENQEESRKRKKKKNKEETDGKVNMANQFAPLRQTMEEEEEEMDSSCTATEEIEAEQHANKKQKPGSNPINPPNTQIASTSAGQQAQGSEMRLNMIIQQELKAKQIRERKQEEERKKQTNFIPKAERIPPIVLKHQRDMQKLNTIAAQLNVKFEGKTTDKGVKIYTRNVEDFRLLRAELQIQEMEHFTHRLRSEKDLKAVLKGIPQIYSEEMVTENLRAQGIPVKSIVRMKFGNEPSEFMIAVVELSNAGKRIFEITKVINMKIRVEPKRRNPYEIQCFRCQKFGHVSFRCNNRTNCLKCGKEHFSRECQEKVKRCANCGKEHKASSLECELNPNTQIKQKLYERREETSYAQAAAQTTQATTTRTQPTTTQNLTTEAITEMIRKTMKDELQAIIKTVFEEMKSKYTSNG